MKKAIKSIRSCLEPPDSIIPDHFPLFPSAKDGSISGEKQNVDAILSIWMKSLMLKGNLEGIRKEKSQSVSLEI